MRKNIALLILLFIMAFGFSHGCYPLGITCAILLCFVWCPKGSLKEFNLKTGCMSFYNIKAAELFVKSSEWVRYNLNIKRISQNQVDIYKNLRLQRSLQLTSPFNDYRKKTVNTLNEYKKYVNNGYYPMTTLEILEASNYNALLLLLDLFRNAKEIKSSNITLRQIVPKLPANEIQFLDTLEEVKLNKNKNIEEFLGNQLTSIKIKPKYYEIEIDQGDNAKEFISFAELLRADFYNKGCEEILVVKYFHSSGTFQIYEPLILRNVQGSFFIIHEKYKEPLKLKIIKFITNSRRMRPLCKIIKLFVRSNVEKDDFDYH